jgi:hypothetical protein
MFEGSIYETLNIVNKYNIENLKIYINVNGYSALAKFDTFEIIQKIKNLYSNIEIRLTDYVYKKFPFVNGLAGHYNLLTEKEMEIIQNA